MAQRGYPGIHAGMPTPQCLRSAIVVNGAPKSTSTARRPYSRPGSCGGVHPSDLFELDLWEQSLLAKAAVHSALMQAGPPLSRASPLPQEKRSPTKKQVGYKAASRWT